MSFVYPILLGGLGLLIVPILIHLIFRQKPRTLRFPAFRFLARKSRTNLRKLQLRHLLLLLMRMLLLALVCLALARPKVSGDLLNLQTDRPVAIILLFDTSYSMQYKTTEGKTRLDEAKEQAVQLLETLHPDSDVIVLNTADPPGAKLEWLKRYKAFAQIQALTLRYDNHPITTRLADAYQLFSRLVLASDSDIGPRLPRVLCVFSDRMDACWDKQQLPRLQTLADAVPPPLERLQTIQGSIPAKVALLQELRTQLNPPQGQDFPEQALIAHWENLRQQIPTANWDNYPTPDLNKLIGQTRGASRELHKKLLAVDASELTQAKQDFREKIMKSLDAGLRELQGVSAFFIDVGLDDATDLGITAVEFIAPATGSEARQAFAPHEKIKLRVLVRATNSNFTTSLKYKLEKTDWESRPISLESGASQPIEFDLIEKLQPGPHQIQVELTGADRLEFTNRRFATFLIRPARKILMITDNKETAEPLRRYIEGNPKVQFECTIRNTGDGKNLELPELAKFHAVYLLNVAKPSPDLWQVLKAYVEQGRSVAIIPPGKNLDAAAYGSAVAKKLLPGQFKGLVGPGSKADKAPPTPKKDAEPEPGVVWDWDEPLLFQRPFLKQFARWNTLDTVDFFKIPRRASSYWEVVPDGKESAVLVRYASAKKDAAILERDFGKGGGKVVLLTTRLDFPIEPAWNNYLQTDTSWFVVFPGELSIYLAGDLEKRDFNFVIGQSLPRVPIPPGVTGLEFQLTGPIPPEPITRPDKGNELLLRNAKVPGNYVVNGNIDVIGKFSMNMPADEGSLQRVPLADIEPLFGKESVRTWRPGDTLQDIMGGVWSTPQEMLPILLLALLVVLALENLLSNLFYRREPKVQETAGAR